MPKLEKERPMTAVKIQTKSDDLSETLERMLKNTSKMGFETGKELEIVIQEVVTPEQLSETVSTEQQKLLDMVTSTIMTKTDHNSTDGLRENRQSMDGYNTDGFKLNEDK